MDIQKFINNNAVAISMIASSGLDFMALLPDDIESLNLQDRCIHFSTDRDWGMLGGLSNPKENTIIRQLFNYMQVPAAFFNVGEELVELTEAGPIWHGKMKKLTIPEAEASKVCFRFPKGAYYGVM